MNYESIRKAATGIVNGIGRISRLDREAEKGRIEGGRRNVEATILLGTNQGAVFEEPDEVVRLFQEKLLEDYAQQEGIFFSYKEICKNREYVGGGMESEVFIGEDKKFVNKVVNYKQFSDTPMEFLDNRISLHNYLFPGTSYELIGFTQTPQNGFCFVVKQFLIKGRKTTKWDRLPMYMESIGFDRQIGDMYYNDYIIVHDLHEGNVLKGEDGRFYFIDTIPELNTKYKFSGKAEYSDFKYISK